MRNSKPSKSLAEMRDNFDLLMNKIVMSWEWFVIETALGSSKKLQNSKHMPVPLHEQDLLEKFISVLMFCSSTKWHLIILFLIVKLTFSGVQIMSRIFWSEMHEN